VVAVVFVERLFQDVTRQMTSAIAIDLKYLISKIEADEDITLTANGLEIATNFPESANFEKISQKNNWLDFSGKYVIETILGEVANARVVDLASGDGQVFVLCEIGGKAVEFSFSRKRVSAVNPHQLLVVMILAAVLLSILAVLFLRNQISPIRRLADAAEAFGKGQSVPLHSRGASEVRSAAHAFLSMRTRIERQIEQRTLMLSGVSHDLRTPLTRLKLSISLMEPNAETALMSRDLDEMQEILDEFLDFARGDGDEQDEMVSPRALAEQLVRDTARSGREVTLIFEGAEKTNNPVKMRRPAVHRAVSNLLSNALKYGDKVNFHVYAGAGFVEFIVEDNGPGIRAEQRDDAVRPFIRLDVSRNQDKGAGVGLGLAIVADIARSHGGSLTLGSSEDLGGLKAAFRLPR
jgi:two-component system osmolarity sensor histidine kinase EnvZ